MKTITQAQAAPLNGEEIVELIKGGVAFVDANKGWITELFKKVGEWISEIKAAPNSPHGRLMRIQALEAQNTLQKELNKINDARDEKTAKYIVQLIEKGVLEA